MRHRSTSSLKIFDRNAMQKSQIRTDSFCSVTDKTQCDDYVAKDNKGATLVKEIPLSYIIQSIGHHSANHRTTEYQHVLNSVKKYNSRKNSLAQRIPRGECIQIYFDCKEMTPIFWSAMRLWVASIIEVWEFGSFGHNVAKGQRRVRKSIWTLGRAIVAGS